MAKEETNDSNLIIFEGKKVTPKKSILIFLNITINSIATSMLATSLTTALPPIMEDLNISVNTGQWLTSGFILFLAVMTPFTAYLITRFKTKPLYFVSVAMFIIGLIICAVSSNFYLMMFGRVIQGVGNSLLSSMGQVIILTIFPKEQIGTMMGWYGLSFGVAPIIAPTIAGLLVDSVGWRMIFVIAIVILVISFIWAIFIFENVLPLMNKHFDVISLGLSILTFGGVTLAISNVGTNDFVSYQVLVPLIVGLIASVFFFSRQLKIKVPFLDVRVLKNKNFTISVIATIVLQFTIMGSSIIIPIYVQQLKGKSATISGLVLLPGSLAMAITSPLAGKIYDKIGMKLLITIGPILLAVTNLSVYFIRIEHSIWIYSGINIFRCIAMGVLLMPLVSWSMIEIPNTKTSDATALYNSFRSIAGAVGGTSFISIMTKVSKAVAHSKPNPEMYGINIVFLIMSITSFIVFLIGLFGCKSNKSKKQDNNKKEIDQDKIDKIEIEIDEGKTKSNHNEEEENSESSTVIDKEISYDKSTNQSDSETEMENETDITSKMEVLDNTDEFDSVKKDDASEIKVVVNN
ncbi:MFS general substrate transporter [Neocallimastix californiae]|jgi:EmrB/QacA subfamily drug resistance transporter|uniref:MFS general substrate transporter n=1 Tax=Neocallimastix californiae TaxID=1754190 RepID=A0A1Y2D4W4_9FUNG|nr:MFS general substrate transporter [Neocallimastix californiae]|eukprot:ORY54338.1 MFS general substrate transporter [Neocallimastix californiae]